MKNCYNDGGGGSVGGRTEGAVVHRMSGVMTYRRRRGFALGEKKQSMDEEMTSVVLCISAH